MLPHEAQMLTEIRGSTIALRRISIEYDADNSFGAAIRDTAYCNFVVTEGGPYRPSAIYTQKYEAHLDDLMAERRTEHVPNELYEERSGDVGESADSFAWLGLTLPPY